MDCNGANEKQRRMKKKIVGTGKTWEKTKQTIKVVEIYVKHDKSIGAPIEKILSQQQIIFAMH